MKRSAVLLALPLMFGVATAQGRIPAPPSQPVAPNTSSEVSADHVVNRGSAVTPPRVTHSPDPKYPKKARKPCHQDTVVLLLIVGTDGLPRDIKVTRSLSPEFDEAALEAVKKWKFDPGTKDGKPVAVKINIEVHFERQTSTPSSLIPSSVSVRPTRS